MRADEKQRVQALGQIASYNADELREWGEENAADMVQIARAALHAEGQGLYSCPTCGENVTRYGQRCPTCEQTERVACVVCGEPAPIYRAERLCTRCFYRLERESGR